MRKSRAKVILNKKYTERQFWGPGRRGLRKMRKRLAGILKPKALSAAETPTSHIQALHLKIGMRVGDYEVSDVARVLTEHPNGQSDVLVLVRWKLSPYHELYVGDPPPTWYRLTEEVKP